MDRTATILQLLAAADRLGEPPVGRTTIVKLVYLAEVLRPTYEIWSQAFDFVRYHYGPYADDVFSHLNFLVFHGFVDVPDYRHTAAGVRARYRITATGHSLGTQLQVGSGRRIARLADDLVWGLQTLGIRGAKNICALVYEEPAFADVLRTGQTENISSSAETPLPTPQSPLHPSFRLQAIISEISRTNEPDVTPRDLVRRYLSYLSVGMNQPDLVNAHDDND